MQGLEKINQLSKLKDFEIISREITNIDFLENNNTIERLDIRFNKITDINIIKTMKSLKFIDLIGNRISDLSVLKTLNLEESNNSLYQNIYINVDVIQGQKVEIEVPQLVKDIMNPNDEFYLNNLKIDQNSTINYANTEKNAKFNEDNTKIILDPQYDGVGHGIETIRFTGNGRLDCTTIYISYNIIGEGDKAKEVQFADADLKQYIQENCDYDRDKKITEYDMAQIDSLYLSNGQEIGNLQGLEYAKNLKTLYIRIKNNYLQNQSQSVDLSVIGKLKKLETLGLSGKISNIDFIKELTKLKSLNLSSYDNVNNLLGTIKNVTSLESLYIDGNIESLDFLSKLVNLNSLTLNGNFQKINNLTVLTNLKKLNYLTINRYSIYMGNVNTVDYSALKNLSKLYTLNLKDEYSDFNCDNIPKTVTNLDLQCNSLANIDKIANLKDIRYIKIEKSKLKNINFIKNLDNIYSLTVTNNQITDMSPLENKNIQSVVLTNNPINTEEEKNAKIIKEYNNDNTKILIVTEMEKTKKIDFENSEFKQMLVSDKDLNRDGEISIYEMEQITYLNSIKYLEKSEYMTNLRSLNFNTVDLTVKEQNTLIKEINKLSSEVSINIYSLFIDLGKIKQDEAKKEINLNNYSPLLVEMQREGSKLYRGKITIRSNDYNEQNTAEFKNNRLFVDTSIIGERNFNLNFNINGIGITGAINVKWSNVTEGDKNKEIKVKDTNFQKVLLENYDIDGDKKFTENDAINLGTIDISNCDVKDLTGIENLKNLSVIDANSNSITDITPILALNKLETADLSKNNITDITCLKNRKFKYVTSVGLDKNYIDFSNNSVQAKTFLDEFQKDINKYGENEWYEDGNAFLCNLAANQKAGTPNTQNNEVKMDSKIKSKLIALGADLNNDGKLTQKELNEVTEYKYENNEYTAKIESLDLSNLGLSSIEGIQYLSGLKEINLSHNKITDLTPLSYMMNLCKINLSYNNITDISKLPNYANNAVQGKEVNLSHNKIKDISYINNWIVTHTTIICGWLAGGDIENNRVLNLDLSYNQIEDIIPVKKYKTLLKLNLSNNNITDISSLKDYNFLLNEDFEKDDELREDLISFKGIDLSSNYIDISKTGNKSAIQVFKNKKVNLNTANQKLKLEFKDVKENDWYYNAVKYVYEKKIMSGKNASTFSPNEKLTRAMLVTMLHNMEGRPYVAGISKFSDVQNTKEWYYVAIKWASAKNIISGYSNGKFGPNDQITREQLAVILNQYCIYKGKYKSVKADYSKFTDSNKISDFAKWGMNWAVGNKIINGSNGKLNPQGTATRAEAAAMLSNYSKVVR